VLEIERQFLVRRIDPAVMDRAERVHSIRQGYLTEVGPAIRVRKIDTRHVMTVKSGGGLVRQEVEFDIEPEVADELFQIADGRVIQKTRYVLGGWELDVFEGRHSGLLIGECELNDAKDPTPPVPSGVDVWREVTEEPGFTNQFLACLDEAEAGELVALLGSDMNAALDWVRARV